MTITTNSLIAKITVGSGGTSSVIFDAIPQTYTDLKVIVSARGERNSYSDDFKVTINNNTSATYSNCRIYYNNNSKGSDGGASTGVANSYSGLLTGTSNTTSTFGSTEFYFTNYSVNGIPKTWSTDGVSENDDTAAMIASYANLISDTNPITILKFESYNSGTIDEFSTFYLYGISSNISTQNTTTPYALGGDVITTDGTYWYHAFKYSGSFTPLKGISADILTVAGGGAGGSNQGGGGGAGGFLYSTSKSLTSGTSYTCSVGAGGSTGDANTNGTSGINSYISGSGFTTLTAIGGGRGGGTSDGEASAGGSGGGSNRGSSTAALGTVGQGNNGGAGGDGSVSAGGGGAGSPGSTGSQAGGGYGGDGLYNALTDAIKIGELSNGHYYIAGGGGGGIRNNGLDGSVRAGGLGGGGHGGGTPGSTLAVSGLPNMGAGGGGGSASGGSDSIGRAGGSGLIIIRYAV